MIPKKWPTKLGKKKWTKGLAFSLEELTHYAERRILHFAGSIKDPAGMWLFGTSHDRRIIPIQPFSYGDRTHPRITAIANGFGFQGGGLAQMMRYKAENFDPIDADPIVGYYATTDATYKARGMTILNAASKSRIPHWGFWDREIPAWDPGEQEAWELYLAALEATHGQFGKEYYLRLGAWKIRNFGTPTGKIIVPLGPTGSGKTLMGIIFGLATVGQHHFRQGASVKKSRFATWNVRDLVIMPQENMNIHHEAMNSLKELAESPIVDYEYKNQTNYQGANGTVWIMPFNDLSRSKWTSDDRRIVGLSAPIRQNLAVVEYLVKPGLLDVMPLSSPTDFLIQAVRKGFMRQWFHYGGPKFDQEFYIEENKKEFDEQCDPEVIQLFRDNAGDTISNTKKYTILPWLRECVETWQAISEEERSELTKMLYITDGIPLHTRYYVSMLMELSATDIPVSTINYRLGKAFLQLTEQLGLKTVTLNKLCGVWPNANEPMGAIEAIVNRSTNERRKT